MPKRAREDEAKREALPAAPRSRPPSRIAAPLLSAVAQRRLHEQQQQEQTTPASPVAALPSNKALARKRAEVEAKLRARATAVRSLGRGAPSQQPSPELPPPSPAPSSARPDAPPPSRTNPSAATDNEDVEMQSTAGTDEDDEATDSRFDALACSPDEFLTLTATTTTTEGPN